MSESKADGTNEGALWGARFATGPSPELAELWDEMTMVRRSEPAGVAW